MGENTVRRFDLLREWKQQRGYIKGVCRCGLCSECIKEQKLGETMNELIEEFLDKYGVTPNAIPDVLLKSGITEQSNLFDALLHLDALKETHPHYFKGERYVETVR